MRNTKRARLVLALLALTALTLIGLDFRGGHASPDSALRRLGADAFGPLESAVNAVVHPIGSALASLGHLGSYSAQLAKLRKQNAALSFQLHRDAIAAARLAHLQALDGLASHGAYRIVHAQVVSYGAALGYEWTIGIDVGSAEGIKVGQTVINGWGLVGRVQAVGSHTATVELAVDAAFVAGAQLAPAGQDCYTTGAGNGPLTLRVLDPSARLYVGEGVVTYPDRAASGLLAPDVPIGRVVSVSRSVGSTTPTAQVRPYVDFTALDYVGVIIEQTRPISRFALLPAANRSPHT
ncbi:MAG: rod shape-determining protein MreC [Mycobacteriales bacterium]